MLWRGLSLRPHSNHCIKYKLDICISFWVQITGANFQKSFFFLIFFEIWNFHSSLLYAKLKWRCIYLIPNCVRYFFTTISEFLISFSSYIIFFCEIFGIFLNNFFFCSTGSLKIPELLRDIPYTMVYQIKLFPTLTLFVGHQDKNSKFQKIGPSPHVTHRHILPKKIWWMCLLLCE